MNDLVTRNRLVEETDWLAVTLAKRAHLRFPPSVEYDDLLQEARMGLMQAADKWDTASPVYFYVYARRRVWGAMMDAHRRRHYLNATCEDLEKAAGVRVMPEYDSAIDCKREVRALAEVIQMLAPRPRAVVALYYKGERKNREIGGVVGLGENRVGQIHRGALVEMRRGLVARGIRRAA